MNIIAIIQSRMTSSRYPGKVLSPFLGKPILAHVVERIRMSDLSLPIVLATSDDVADDPLALYGNYLSLCVARGPRDDVFGRFIQVLRKHSCEAFFRVCGDSPLLNPFLFEKAVAIYKNTNFDIITNVFPRTFPIGMSVELVQTNTFLSLEKIISRKDDREHITQFYYNNPKMFNIKNIECVNPADSKLRLAVDEIDDLKNIERWLQSDGRWECLGIK
jgi:spore coat polysaccharide biosynthesis protein SpsF